MTENEAKTKWCPHARVTTYAMDDGPGMTATNKTSGGAIRDGARCIASQCMAWRWRLEYTPAPIPELYDVQILSVTTGASKTDGYCGLAGAPA